MTARALQPHSATAVYPPWLERRFAPERARLASLTPFSFGNHTQSARIELHRNDYLRIGNHPAVVRARRVADGRASAGDTLPAAAHDALRRLLGTSLQATDVVLTASGWCANVGLIEALAAPDVPVYHDEESHGSMRDGAALAHARLIEVPHHDASALDRLIARFGPGIVCIDAVNSTRGCRAPVREYLDICERHDCVLVLDESHAFGMMGPGSGGLAAALECAARVHFRTLSFGKALGGHGGAIVLGGDRTKLDTATRRHMHEFHRALALRFHPVLFSSPTSPAIAAGHECALRLAIAEPWRAAQCVALASRFRDALAAEGIPGYGGASQIVSIAFEDLGACRLFEALRDRGVLGAVFLPPVIARGSLLRFTVHAEITAQDIDETVALLLDSLGSTRCVPVAR